jgi:hypothetical protein
MQNYARVGGILSIVAGGFGVLWVIAAVLIIIATFVVYNEPYYDVAPSTDVLLIAILFYAFMGLLFLAAGVLAIVGGVFALRKKVWGLALTGAIAGTIAFFPCGIPAIIFTSLGRKEFNNKEPPAPAVVNG